jgi:SNF2 family DNA or RNA helicase
MHWRSASMSPGKVGGIGDSTTMPLFRSTPSLLWSRNERGLVVAFASMRDFDAARCGRGPEALQLTWLRMRLLLEQGYAEECEAAAESNRGIFLETEQAVRLDAETRDLFLLPPAWPGSFRLEVRGIPKQPSFSVALLLRDSRGRDIRQWRLSGPILEIGDELYLPTPEQYAALRAVADWKSEEPSARDEYTNLALLARLNAAYEAGCPIDLEAFSETKVSQAGELEVEASEHSDGTLVLTPRFAGALTKFDGPEIERRLLQLGGDASRAVLRVRNRIVLLDNEQTRRARDLLRNRHVPQSEREAFLRDPASWLTAHVFPDADMEFCPRVTGVEIWRARYFGAAPESGIDWFDRKPGIEEEETKDTDRDGKAGESGKPPDDAGKDEKPESGHLIYGFHDNDQTPTYGRSKLPVEESREEAAGIDFNRYSRRPLPHQEEAIGWLVAHARRIFQSDNLRDKQDPGGGVLLADDMGLGKTFSTLVFLGEWMRWLREQHQREPEAVLVVAPVTLLENWREEIRKSYPESAAVFRRITYAYPEGELARFKRSPDSRDEAEPGEGDPRERMKSWGLHFGTGGPESVDWPGSLVFTTYATLRNYRFSFGACRWSVAIFDEAQNLKNPNALQTVAAKALNARYRILATGTPVENHLGDFWSLLDLSEPSWLGSFQEFRRAYIAPLIANRERVVELGRDLRTKVGGLMLRRMKEDELEGLPRKTIVLHENVRAESFDERITSMMGGKQRELYDQALDAARAETTETADSPRQQNRWLAALWHLREVTLHPALLSGGRLPIGSSPAESERILRESAKLGVVIEIINRIRDAGEKVLIFAVNKRLQEGLAANLARIYGFDVPVINGDAPTGTRSRSPEAMNRTRFGMIETFQRADGFRICILSPLAAGVGLTITAANHVIHLERHWNPAKEAQATDRVYRIGQTRDVLVHVPILLHPERASYDVNLDKLLRSKMRLQDALTITAPEEVTADEVLKGIFGEPGAAKPHGNERPLRAEDVAGLSWELFEALVAEIYSRDARDVILTLRSADHGCDVVVLGHDSAENRLIQCKHTTARVFEGDVAIREVASSRAHYENRLGERFPHLAVCTPCRKFSRQSREAALLHNVELFDADWLQTRITAHNVSHGDLLRRTNQRRKV